MKLGLVPLVFGLSLAMLSWMFASNPNYRTIRADGMGYYAYLPAILDHRDLSFENFHERMQALGYPDNVRFHGWTGISRYPGTGQYLNKYNCGVAILLLPFYALATVLAVILHFPLNGVSPPFQLCVGFAGITALTLGVRALESVLSNKFVEKVVTLSLLLLVFGTNLFSYATFESSFSHVYSFCLVSLILAELPRWYEARNVAASFRLGGLLGLALLVRLTNLPVALLIVFYGVSQLSQLSTRIRFLLARWPHLLLMAGTIGFCFLPQMLIWKNATGHFWVYSYQTESFCRPHIAEVLFSLRRGAFVWTPMLAVGLFGFLRLEKSMPQYALGAIVLLVAHLLITSSWCTWWYGASLGQRALIDMYGPFAIPFTAGVDWFYQRRWGRVFISLLFSVVIFNLYVSTLYWYRAFPGYVKSWDQYFRVLNRGVDISQPFGRPIKLNKK